MQGKIWVAGLVAAVVFSTMAFGFDAYFSDSQGNKIWQIWEGRRFWVVVDDRELGQCPPGEFFADLVIFDFKTGAYIQSDSARFLEIPNESGIYYWVDDVGNKVWVQAGDRSDWIDIQDMEHVLGTTALGDIWNDGNWIYLDEDVDPPGFDGTVVDLPQNREAWRAQADAYDDTPIVGRLENMDTLVLIVAARHDERLIDQDQMKIIDTTAQITVEPTHLEYGCGAMCNVRVQITDPDENLDPTEIDHVPFFLIINPGSWNPDSNQTDSITTFCALKMFGGVDSGGNPRNIPIRWYNIYDAPVSYDVNNDGDTADPGETSRFIDYPNDWLDNGIIAPVQFYAWETAPDSGVFVYDFGLLENLQALLGFDRFESGTTLAFYYLDPNDFDDFVLATAEVYDRPHSETFITDANGIPVEEVRLGSHHGLYVRVYDADANIEACCQDKVVVHLCDPHNEDDSEYWMIDEVSNDSGIFASQAGMPLLPVWDAVGGYQLVFDSWTFEAFNEDSIYARYNSVEYEQEDLNLLGDGDPNDDHFPPRIVETASRHQPWDVSFDLVKVYDFQVFEAEAETHHMRFLDGTYSPVEEIPLSGNLYLEVTDLDQNEQPLMRELIFGGWNKDAEAGEDTDEDEDSNPVWEMVAGIEGAPSNVDDLMTPNGALSPELETYSITNIPATVKVFMWNAQRGTWERVDLRETAVGSGIFRSTTCVLVADARHPGDGNLASQAGDTIFAFYQDPSNHSDISIIQIKVSEGGAAGVTPPVGPQVAFDANTYMPGDTVTVTVTDPRYAGATEIAGTGVLVITDSGGAEIASFDSLPQVDSDQFQVSFVLPDDVALGTITATYTDPTLPTRQAQDTAEVIAAELEDVTGISVTPNPFAVTTTFALVAEPAGAVADEFEITIYDLVGRKVAELAGTGVAELVWDGGDLRNGAYIYVATVTYDGTVEVFRGFVYINR